MPGASRETMTPALFNAFRDLAYERAGIRISEVKEPMLAARVGRRVRALGLSGEREYLEVLRKDGDGREIVQFLDAIATNFTNFFREPDHFDVLKAEVQRRLAARQV